MKKLNKKELWGILVGMLLGDGSINKDGNLRITHSPKQKDYLKYKQKLLSGNLRSNYTECYITHKNGKKFLSCTVTFGTSKFTKELRKLFYTPSKHITKKLVNHITVLGLAIWYMDDGCLAFTRHPNGSVQNRCGYLHTQSFDYEEQLILQQLLKDKFDINTKIQRDKKYYKLYLSTPELSKLLDLIHEYIPDSMKYKECYRYNVRNTDRNLCKKPCDLTMCPYHLTSYYNN